MGYTSIHETVVNDILDLIKDGIKFVDGKFKSKNPKIKTSGSLARATSGLTLVFPVYLEDSIDIETATMISKAIERKNVSLLQMAFSAYNITNATDAITHLSKFHTNLDVDKLTVDKFIDIMDSLEESSTVFLINSDLQAINSDCKSNCNFTLSDSINEFSLLEFSEIQRNNKSIIIKEARPANPYTGKQYTDDELDTMQYGPGSYYNDPKGIQRRSISVDIAKDIKDRERQDNIDQFNKDDADRKYNANIQKINIDIDKNNNDARSKLGDASDKKRQYLSSQLVSSEVKKANEMQPSLMVVNFYVNDKDRDLNIAQQVVAGVKSKLYPISSSDIVNKIITKTIDSDILLKLVKVSTREISFVKDFLLGLDNAKLDALSRSKRGSASALFSALERRSIKGKIRKTLKLDNSAKAITTLVINNETAEQIKKYNNIDVFNIKTISNFMEKMNLLYFIVVDSVSESISILTDGDSEYEVYSFSSLERETGDGAYKKVVKLMSNMSL